MAATTLMLLANAAGATNRRRGGGRKPCAEAPPALQILPTHQWLIEVHASYLRHASSMEKPRLDERPSLAPHFDAVRIRRNDSNCRRQPHSERAAHA